MPQHLEQPDHDRVLARQSVARTVASLRERVEDLAGLRLESFPSDLAILLAAKTVQVDAPGRRLPEHRHHGTGRPRV